MKAWIIALISLALAVVAATFGYRLPACAAEDGGPYPCVWEGPSRGNDTGPRVVVWSDD